MQHIDTRTQLIEFICENISQRAIARACHTGTVIVLGGFDPIPPSGGPGWIVVIISVHGRTWHVAVTPNDYEGKFEAWVTSRPIPWLNYIGWERPDDPGWYSIYDGDNPHQACLAKKRADQC